MSHSTAAVSARRLELACTAWLSQAIRVHRDAQEAEIARAQRRCFLPDRTRFQAIELLSARPRSAWALRNAEFAPLAEHVRSLQALARVASAKLVMLAPADARLLESHLK